ncbi:MAG: hypothetical protein ABFD46_06445 [Armatimonadota bacterium]
MRQWLVIMGLVAALAGVAPAENLSRPWFLPAPGSAFPRFFSSALEQDYLLNDFFLRHWSALPGPGAYSGNQQTFWREWNALTTLWMDTSINRANGRDYNADLKDFLLRVQMDSDGYVFTYAGPDYRDKMGWPFPTYKNSGGQIKGWDWDSPDVGQDGWTLDGGATLTIGDDGTWKMMLTEPGACIEAHDLAIDSYQSPYLIVQFSATVSGPASLEWTTDQEPNWSEDNRIEFTSRSSAQPSVYYLAAYQHPGWKGKITGLRLRPLINVPEDGFNVTLDRIHCAYDTRQVVNNTSFILASRRYYLWTGDDDFLRKNIDRIRAAAHYLRGQLRGDAEGMVVIPYRGHDGTSGVSPKVRTGYGLGSDYWSLLPMGYRSAYTNAYYVAALNAMSDIENAALKLKIKSNPFNEDGASFKSQATAVAKKAGDLFWDAAKGRFIGCQDAAGKRHDYGFVYLNLEALYYGLGDSDKAKSIYSWLDGERVIKGDTSTGKDIYHWRFAPRATTQQNKDWYFWGWRSGKWGDQVQDGGTSAYISFYDIMDRIKYKSADDAYARLLGILSWYGEVQDAGGYGTYYAKPGHGVLQGGSKVGALGIDSEFVETALVPLSFLYGFLGVDATPEGLMIEPKIPAALTGIGVQGLTYHSAELTIAATNGKITIKCTRNPANKSFLLGGRRVTGTFERTVDANYAVLVPGD